MLHGRHSSSRTQVPSASPQEVCTGPSPPAPPRCPPGLLASTFQWVLGLTGRP